MRFGLLMLAVLVAASALAQEPRNKEYQTGICPPTPSLETYPTGAYWFEGSIGPKQVRMYLERGGSVVVGVYYDLEDWAPFILGGSWTDRGEGAIDVTARANGETEIGRLQGQLTTTGLVGVWKEQETDSGVRFQLKTAVQPSCDGKGEWQRFANSNWPITFSYPATWHLKADAQNVTLTCPDPSLMAYEYTEINITLRKGAGDRVYDFVQCGDNWAYGPSCTCTDVSRCADASVAKQDGMTVLGGDQREWRIYCRGGGYVAQGEGHLRIFLLEHGTVEMIGQGEPSEIMDRIIAATKRNR